MFKKLLVVSLFVTNTLWAAGPTIECRFGALTEDGDVGLHETVAYTLNPLIGVTGDFEPYNFDIAVHKNSLTIGVYLHGEPLLGTQIPVANVVNLPVGASLFGVSIVFHKRADDFVSLRYECRKVLW